MKRQRPRNNTSGYPGVHFKVADRRWIAVIQVANARHHLGYFDSFDEAVAARKTAERRFARGQRERMTPPPKREEAVR
jgi:hypothetical protein